VSIWHSLSDQDIIAVPPFTFTSFVDLMRATYGWMHYRLEEEAPNYTNRLDELHEQYLEQELEDYAKEKGEKFSRLDIEQLEDLLAEMEDEVGLDLNIDPVTLINFFDDCTELALEAGFDGLVVLPDELQQYFKSAASRQDAEADFRDLVFDMHSGAKLSARFGFIVSMPDTTKSNLDSQAGDIIQRLQNDNLSINLQTVYGRDFPAQLWERYASEYNFTDDAEKIVPRQTLNAIGQICSRQDLSAGPRTVIDIFRIALTDYLNNEETFTPVRLAEAFYEGRVRYDQNAKIEAAIRDGLQNSKVTTDDEETVIKICAVYPAEGLPEDIAAGFGVEETYKSLQKKLHGTLLTWVADGYTLTGVTPDDEPDDIRQELLRQFWKQYDTDDVNAEFALEAFATEVLDEEVFQTNTGKLIGWATGSGFQPIQPNVYTVEAEGTFNARYPQRRLAVGVTDHAHRDELVNRSIDLGNTPDTADVAFDFILDYSQNPAGHIEQLDDRHFVFTLNGQKAFENLPSGMQYLQKSMNPRDVTPFLLLSLITFIDEQDRELDASQEKTLEGLQDRLVSESISHLFDRELLENAPFELRRAGKQIIEAAFDEAMETLFPEYETLLVSTQYQGLIGDYKAFLSSLNTVSKRRGRTPIEESKEDIVDRFNLRGNSAFMGRAKKQYSNLIEVEEWEGDQAVVRAKLHPLEEHVIETLEAREETMSKQEFFDMAYERGYRSDELKLLLDIMAERGVVQTNKYDEFEIVESDLSVADVDDRLSDLQTLIDRITELDPERVSADEEEWVADKRGALTTLTDDDVEQLEVMNVEARQLESRFEDIGKDLHAKYRSAVETHRSELESKERGFIPSELSEDIQGAVRFVGNLNDIRTRLKSDYQSLRSQLTEQKSKAETALEQYDSRSLDNAEKLREVDKEIEATREEIASEEQQLRKHYDHLREWETLTSRTANIKQNIVSYSQTFDEEIDEERQIKRFISNVTEQLTNDPWEAIGNVQAYSEKLDGINQSFKEQQTRRREVFDEKKTQLKEVLQTATDRQSRGLRRAQFNIDDPEGSRQNLIEDFRSEFNDQVIEQARERLTAAEQDVVYATIIDATTDEGSSPDEIAAGIDQARAKMEELSTTISQFTFSDVGTEQMADLGDGGAAVLADATDLRNKARQFLTEREPDNEPLVDLLDEIETRREVNFKELLMDFHDEGEEVDPETLLERVNELFILNQVDIKISSRRR
jgi:hypothetical protein